MSARRIDANDGEARDERAPHHDANDGEAAMSARDDGNGRGVRRVETERETRGCQRSDGAFVAIVATGGITRTTARPA